MPFRPASLKDISAATGVSVTAVSHVLNDRLGHVRVSDATRSRVLGAARRLGYVPKLHARSMATKRSYSVGVLCALTPAPLGPSSSVYFMAALRGIEEVCKPANHHTLFASCEMGDPALFVEPRLMKDGSVDGVLIVGHMSSPVARRIKNLGLPVIQIGSNVDPDLGIETVAPDLDSSIATVTDHFLARGRTHVHLFLPTGPGPEQIRRNFAALAASRPTLRATPLATPAEWGDEEQGYRYAQELLAAEEADFPHAIICSHIHADGLVRAMEAAGRRVPDDYDLAIIASEESGFPLLGPRATRTHLIRGPVHQVGRRAASRLLQLLEVDHPLEPQGPLVACPVHFADRPSG